MALAAEDASNKPADRVTWDHDDFADTYYCDLEAERLSVGVTYDRRSGRYSASVAFTTQEDESANEEIVLWVETSPSFRTAEVCKSIALTLATELRKTLPDVL